MSEPRNDVFVGEFAIELKGHVGSFGSNADERTSAVDCTCGWAYDGRSATEAMDSWRAHIEIPGQTALFD